MPPSSIPILYKAIKFLKNGKIGQLKWLFLCILREVIFQELNYHSFAAINISCIGNAYREIRQHTFRLNLAQNIINVPIYSPDYRSRIKQAEVLKAVHKVEYFRSRGFQLDFSLQILGQYRTTIVRQMRSQIFRQSD